MILVSSQDFRNSYERFYKDMRRYLWPYEALKALAFVEDDIFTSFIDFDALRRDLDKLYVFIRDEMKDDEFLSKAYTELSDMLSEATKDPENTKLYSTIPQIEEVNPEIDKVLSVQDEEDEEEDEYYEDYEEETY